MYKYRNTLQLALCGGVGGVCACAYSSDSIRGTGMCVGVRAHVCVWYVQGQIQNKIGRGAAAAT